MCVIFRLPTDWEPAPVEGEHVLLQVVDRLVCMDAGRVIADGDPQAVLHDAAVIDAYLGRADP